MFAKLFEHEKHGQLLVKMDMDQEGSPEIRTFFEPEGFGVCSIAIGFPDTDEGWDGAETLFQAYGIEQAVVTVEGVMDRFVSEFDQL